MEIKTYPQAVEYLFSRRAKGMKLGLDNIRNLVERLGHPENRFPSVHVAGTNGKGSTVAILESILRQAGYQSGRYISPHLVDMRERIQIRGESISERDVVEMIRNIKPHIEAAGASFFEILTAMGFLAFAGNKVDIAVLETGLGGRLDATNVVTPLLTLVTEIGLEHTRILGNRLEAIAGEKAGIFKPGIPCLSGASHSRARKALARLAAERDVPITFTKNSVRISGVRLTDTGSWFDCQTNAAQYRNLILNLLGSHQVRNAALALLAVDRLRDQGWHITEDAVRKGLENVPWQARLQVLRRNPTVLLDSAHNPMGIRTLVKALNTLFTYDRLVLVFGVLRDKAYRQMYNRLAPLADVVILTRPLSDRALDPEELTHLPASKDRHVEVIPDISKAWNRAMTHANRGDLVCGAGSIYFVGEVLRFIETAEKYQK